MIPPPALLLAPVLVFLVVGLGLAAAYRSASPKLLLRLAAVFLALWSIVATTLLVFLVSFAGPDGLVQMARSPGSAAALFGWAALPFWIGGALGALAIFAVAFSLNQAVGRGILYQIDPIPLPWPEGLDRPASPVLLVGSRSPGLEAYSFTLLTASVKERRIGRTEVIVLSEGLRTALSEEELTAVVAHEVGHIQGLDGRYLTFVRTLSRMMRWDPLFAVVARTMTRHEEYRADDDAVRATHRPLALARALYKASVPAGPRTPLIAAGFLGVGGRSGYNETIARIRRLVEMAESGAPPEGPGA